MAKRPSLKSRPPRVTALTSNIVTGMTNSRTVCALVLDEATMTVRRTWPTTQDTLFPVPPRLRVRMTDTTPRRSTDSGYIITSRRGRRGVLQTTPSTMTLSSAAHAAPRTRRCDLSAAVGYTGYTTKPHDCVTSDGGRKQPIIDYGCDWRVGLPGECPGPQCRFDRSGRRRQRSE